MEFTIGSHLSMHMQIIQYPYGLSLMVIIHLCETDRLKQKKIFYIEQREKKKARPARNLLFFFSRDEIFQFSIDHQFQFHS